jgi:hypothetical protein
MVDLPERVAYQIETVLWHIFNVRGPDVGHQGDVIEFMVTDRKTGEEALVKVIRVPQPPF